MSMEGAPSREKNPEIPKFSMEEWKKYSGGASSVELDSDEQRKWMEENGIKFDSGIVEVEIDGNLTKIVTKKDDFGTWVDEGNH